MLVLGMKRERKRKAKDLGARDEWTPEPGSSPTQCEWWCWSSSVELPQIADLELGALHLGPILLNSTSALGFTIQENWNSTPKNNSFFFFLPKERFSSYMSYFRSLLAVSCSNNVFVQWNFKLTGSVCHLGVIYVPWKHSFSGMCGKNRQRPFPADQPAITFWPQENSLRMTIRLLPLESKDSFYCTLSPVPGTVVHIDRTRAPVFIQKLWSWRRHNVKSTNNNSQRLLVSRSTPLAPREKGSP